MSENSCQFLLTGGSMVTQCVLLLLLSKNHKIAKNSTTTKAREKNKHRSGILRILQIFYACMTTFKNNQILLYKISCRFQLTAKLYTG